MKKQKKTILLLKGGLGNQFYQFCALEVISGKLKTLPFIDLNYFNKNISNYRKVGIFKLLDKINYTNSIDINNKKYRFLFLKIYNKFPKLYDLIIRKKLLNDYNDLKDLLGGNIKNETIINGYFQFHKTIEDSILGKYLKSKYSENNSNESLAIHIRLGDYLRKPYSDIYWNFNEDYLSSALDEIKKIYGSDFIKEINLYSDSIELANNIIKKVLPPKTKIKYSKSNNLLDELIHLSNSKVKILSNSTFSLLSYYLNYSETTIIPRTWYKKIYKTPSSLFPKNNYNGKVIIIKNSIC